MTVLGLFGIIFKTVQNVDSMSVRQKKMASYKLKCPVRNVQYGADQCRLSKHFLQTNDSSSFRLKCYSLMLYS